ncbi:hypothetical protein AAGW05_17480 [Arthrobacter sp. LAPM80]|uniref:hypothetical protein n=1 Tax=Arthrobacter sp. LAPM80 TaxID=3141788 RepID=UPI00398BB208
MSEQSQPMLEGPDDATVQDDVPAAPVLAAPVPAASVADGPGAIKVIRRRAGSRRGDALVWRRTLSFSVFVGIVAGILWWLLAPSGAFYGEGTDATTWFPRDATLAALLVIAGVLTAALAMRRLQQPARRSEPKSSASTGAFVFALAVGGLLGSVIAWRMGLFAGDLFRTPPANMPNPSIVFSLRSGPVLLLWPLAGMLFVFVQSFISTMFGTDTRGTVPHEMVDTVTGANG